MRKMNGNTANHPRTRGTSTKNFVLLKFHHLIYAITQVPRINWNKIIESGIFNLRKWIPILEYIEVSSISNEILSTGESETFKILGIQWLSRQVILKHFFD